MKRGPGYRVLPFGRNRQMVAAGMAVSGRWHTMHAITEVDVTEPRRLIREHRERTGEGLSLTAYVIACLARAVAENPRFNAMRRGGKLFVFEDVTVGTHVERVLGGERIAEPFGIRAADKKTYREIHDEIRAAQRKGDEPLGAVSGTTWWRFVPGFLLRGLVLAMSRSVRMAGRYGVVGVTNVGMFGDGPGWGLPLTFLTVAVTVGGIARRPVMVEDEIRMREHLCLTLSFDHDLFDGAPAARFTGRFLELLAGGDALRKEAARDANEVTARDAKGASS